MYCPWNPGTDPDQDPRIRTTDFRIRILLFSSGVLSSCQQKISFFSKFFCLLPFEGTFTVHLSSKIKSHKRFSSLFCLIMEGSGFWMRTNNDVPDPRGSKTYGSGSTPRKRAEKSICKKLSNVTSIAQLIRWTGRGSVVRFTEGPI